MHQVDIYFSVYCNFKNVKKKSHAFLIDNHVGLHSSQNASYTGAVCDLHLRLTAKPSHMHDMWHLPHRS